MNMRILALLALLLPSSAFCKANGKGRLYDLQSGKVSQVEYTRGAFSSHGKIWITTEHGQKLSGEYSLSDDGLTTWGTLYSTIGGVSGSAMSVGGINHNALKGTAIIAGEGVVIQCEFLATGSHGSGGCRDQAGNLFKLMF